MFEKQVIEVAPLAYMRGRTLDDAFIILDEAHKRAAVDEDPLMAAMEKNKYKGNGGKQTWKKNS